MLLIGVSHPIQYERLFQRRRFACLAIKSRAKMLDGAAAVILRTVECAVHTLVKWVKVPPGEAVQVKYPCR